MKASSFKSAYFKVLPFEDDEINPGVLGKSLSSWVAGELKGTEFEIQEEIKEDFGYCLMIKRKPYWLWVGCSGSSNYDYPEGGLTAEIAGEFPIESIEWNVWVTAEMGFFSKLFGDDRKQETKALESLLLSKLSEVGVEFVE